MIQAGAISQINAVARNAARSTDGDVERMASDMEKYAVEGVSSGISFGLSHIPFAGPAIAKGYDLGSAAGITAFYKKKLEDATTRRERIQYATSYLERSLAADMRKAYNLLMSYDKALTTVLEEPPEDCQGSYRKLYITQLADSAVEDLGEWAGVLTQLAEDLTAVAQGFETKVTAKKNSIDRDLDGLRHRHPPSKCMGLQRCYWVPDAVPTVGTVVRQQGGRQVRVPGQGSDIGNEDL